MTKGKAFSIMAVNLSGNHGFPHLQGDELKKRYERYYDMYKRAREWLAVTGSGLTEEEISLGYTIEKKMHEKCPHIYRINVVFGNRANVNPSALGSLGLGSEEILSVVDSQLPGIEECQIGVEIPEESRIVEEDHGDDFLAEEFYVEAELMEMKKFTRSMLDQICPHCRKMCQLKTRILTRGGRQSLKKLRLHQKMLKLQRLEDEKNRRRESVRLEEVKKRWYAIKEERKKYALATMEEAKKWKFTMFLELTRAGKSVSEIEELIELLDDNASVPK
ncbi:hypothetical protein R1sor_003085 [Riccia sorocarpa]|uniref:Uncharacterized protein n=1 Tax=Riccia sorocarpa TaxID=122646 RepID=A0ABD3H0Z4_9MARC